MREWKHGSGFDEVIGHRDIVTHLKNAVQTGKVSHAYLFSGEKGSGKHMLATYFAMALECQEQEDVPCMHCPSCKKALSGNHPDIKRIVPESASSLGVEALRTQLVEDVSIRPYERPYKVYIVDDADLMTVQAQNAILKTIEEPPAYAVVILLSENSDRLLETIRSRCTELDFRPVEDKEIEQYLMNQMELPDYQAAIVASYAQGNVGKAVRAVASSEFMEMTRNAVQLMKSSESLDSSGLIEAVKLLNGEKQNIDEYLELFSMWFRDVLLFKATREVDQLIFKQEINEISERAACSSYEGIETILKAIDTAAVRLRANVNFDLVMELLFLTIREN